MLQTVTTLDVALSRMVKVNLSNAQRAALLSWQYNVGTAAVESSTLLRWDKATVRGHLIELGGLKDRRGYERAVFLGQVAPMKLNSGDV